MSLNHDLKNTQISEIQRRINQSNSILIFEYHGLNVDDLKKLRDILSLNEIEAKVYKNRLFKIALKNSQYEDLTKYLNGPNMFVFGKDDEILLIKKIVDFSKDHNQLKVKAAIFEGKVIDSQEIIEIAGLPSHSEALTQLMMTLLTPLRHISLIMNQIKDAQNQT